MKKRIIKKERKIIDKKSLLIGMSVLLILIFIELGISQLGASLYGSYNTNYGAGSWNSGFYGGSQAYTGGYYSGYYGSTGSYQNFQSGPRVYGASINPQYGDPSFYSSGGYTNPGVYWPKFRAEDCLARQDFIMQIAPGGCSPAVVRSDLLEEQNVPVFCKVMGLQINPLIDVSRVRSLRFKGEYPEGISGISYFPARAAIRSGRGMISSPLEDNLGYLVVVLSKNEIEGEMPDYIAGNITAVIDYDVEKAFGIGNTNFYLSEMTDEEWFRNHKQYGFWNGKGYIRADSIYYNEATISVYRDANSKQSTITLKTGESSKDIYLGGFYCGAGLNIGLQEIGAPVDSALLQINDQQVWVVRGDRIMNGKCSVTNLETYGGGGRVGISCPVQNGRFDLTLNPGKAKISNQQRDVKEYIIGEEIDIANTRNVYLAYVGLDRGVKYAVIIKDDFSLSAYDFAEKDVYSLIDQYVRDDRQIGTENIGDKIKQAVLNHYSRGIRGFGRTENMESMVDVEVLTEGKPSNHGIYIEEASVARNRDWNYESEGESIAKEYYEQAIMHYEDLADFYPFEKMDYTQEDPYSAIGLYRAAQLARTYEQNEKAQELFTRLIRDYEGTYVARIALREKELLTKYDSRNAKAIVHVNNELYTVNILEFKKPTREEASAVMLIDGKEEVLGIQDIRTLERDGRVESIQVESIDNEYITIRHGNFDYRDYYRNFYGQDYSSNQEYYSEEDYIDYDNDGTINVTERQRYERENPVRRDNTRSSYSYRTQRMRIGEQTILGSIPVRLLDIRIKEQAKISLTSKTFGPRTESNFTFKIGIEKRGIKLSTDQTKEMIENLEETIKEFSDANAKLYKVVKGMKAACFATAAMMNIKSLFDGLSGKSLSRKEIMTNQEGWNDYCKELVEEGERSSYTGEGYSSIQSCLLAHNSQIDEEIDLYTEKIEETNNILKQIQEGVGVKKTDILDFEGQVNIKDVEEKFKQRFDVFCQDNAGNNITLPKTPTREQEQVPFAGKNGICEMSKGMTHEQRREIMTLVNVRDVAKGENTVLGRMAIKNLERTTLDAKTFYENNAAREQAQKEAEQYNLGLKEFIPLGDQVDYGAVKTITSGDSGHRVYRNYGKGESVIRITMPFRKSYGTEKPFEAHETVAGKTVIVQVKQDEFLKDYTPDPKGKLFLVDGTLVTGKAKDSVMEYLSLQGISRIRPLNQKAYQNKMINPERIKVEYFEREPYKGLPSLVPFDVINGWYVKLTYVLSGFGRPYDESGRAVNFWICNVGENGQIDFKRSADDICIYYNGHLDEFHQYGMDRQEFAQLVNRAQQALNEAVRQYGNSRAIINGRSFETGISLGGEEGRCSDFMSPEDCHIMFNVCDPVICPASRCDLGGRYRVDNVIQTGVIGSLMLCLPNAKEGIMIPICLTGVHAGIEGYISILNSTVQCLNESLETGRNIGICDEIKSIYLCEFFWKQLGPLINVIIPRVLESFYSQGVRGGGEYLTVQEAWDNTQSSIDYFTNDYAVNSMLAFNQRSTAEVGSEICKNYVSMRYPTSESMFDRLIEPDSPVQYHGWFDENQMTTATIPATSHYKVYYHIYAGRDEGAYYSVYLKDLPKSSYVYTMDYQVVDQGYVSRGSQIDQAKDFSAPSGYKQLCISVNGRDECGFGSVSTSYAVNRINDEYVKDQMEAGIKASKQCVAGTPSFYSFAQPNLQAGAEEVLGPELYNRGIVRVCSSQNPGKQVTPTGEFDTTASTYDRWKEVGYCDDPTIKCWLDTYSVKDVIKDSGMEKQVLDEIDTSIFGQLDFWTEQQSRGMADWAENAIDALVFEQGESRDSIENKIIPIVERLTALSNLGATNVHKARAHFLLGRLYKRIAENIKPEFERGGVLSPEDYGKIFLDDQSYTYGEIDAPTVDCNVNDARLIDRNIETGDSFKMLVKFSGACEDWDVLTVDPVPGANTEDPRLIPISYKLTKEDIRRKQVTLPENQFLDQSKIDNPGTYGFRIGTAYETEINGVTRMKTQDFVETGDNQNLILIVEGEEPLGNGDDCIIDEDCPEGYECLMNKCQKIEEPIDNSKVTWEDINSRETDAGTVYYMQVYDPQIEDLRYVTFVKFDLENQRITYADGTSKKVSKDEQGRIIL